MRSSSQGGKARAQSPKEGRVDRSRIAMRKGAAVRRAGKSYEEMCAALRADPETAAWCREKGDRNNERELHRIWERAADPVAALVTEFNERFMIVREAGKAVIYSPACDPILQREYYDRLSFSDLRQLYLNRTVVVRSGDDGSPVRKPAAEVWLHHRDRRQFIGGVSFDPSGQHARPDVFNLWRGFAVEPRPGQWEMMEGHIKNVICNSQQDHYDYLMDWLARMVQRPAEQGEVAVVMCGDEGTGKGTLARAMFRILGQHALVISNSRHLIGNFNAHLRDCVFLFADEAFFAGDRQHVSVLKSIITEPYLTIEAKYQNAVQAPNFLQLMMASNEEWVVPASLGARRFFVLEVSDAKKDDHEYFASISAEMEAGGYEAMLHDLLQRDLTGFNVRRIPATDGLQQQKKLSLGTSDAWWSDVLHRGYVFRSKLGLESIFGEWHEEIATELLYASYMEFAERRRERHPMGRETFGRFMVTLGAKPKRMSEAMVGEHLIDAPYGVGTALLGPLSTTEAAANTGEPNTADVRHLYRTTRKAEPILHPRPPGYLLGTLDAARTAFTEKTQLRIEWQDDDHDNAAQLDTPPSG